MPHLTRTYLPDDARGEYRRCPCAHGEPRRYDKVRELAVRVGGQATRDIRVAQGPGHALGGGGKAGINSIIICLEPGCIRQAP